jgi:hypothetical protein
LDYINETGDKKVVKVDLFRLRNRGNFDLWFKSKYGYGGELLYSKRAWGLSEAEADTLFAHSTTLEQMEEMIAKWEQGYRLVLTNKYMYRWAKRSKPYNG